LALSSPAEEENGGVPWEQYTSDTDNPMARADTVVHGHRSQASATHRIQQHPYFWYFVAAGVFILILIAGILWALFRGSPDAKTGSTSRASVRTLYVTNNKDSREDFLTLKDALRQAKPGDCIVVRKPIHEEHLQIENRKWGKGLIIEGDDSEGARVVWRMPPNSKERALLELHNIEGLMVKGFTFDGGGRLDDLVVLFGQCPGVTLEDVHFQGFMRSAVKVTHCTGTADRPVTMTGLRVITANKAEAALLFNFQENIISPRGNEHIRVVNGIFAGPFQAAVQLMGREEDIEFRGNRFFDAANGFIYKPGFTYKPGKDYPPLQTAVIANTFCRLQTGLTLESLPLAANPVQESRIVLEKNLFAQTAVLANVVAPPSAEQLKNGGTLQSLADQLIRSSGNVRDPGSKEGNVILNAFAVSFPPLPQNPNDSQRFLHFPKDSPLKQRGSPGAPPEE
jgi:hypothetical protein